MALRNQTKLVIGFGVFILIVVFIFVHANKIPKDEQGMVVMKKKPLIVGHTRHADYMKIQIDLLLSIAFPEREIIWSNDVWPDLGVSACYAGQTPHPNHTHFGQEIPYIQWSAEYYRGDTITLGRPILEVFNSIPPPDSVEYLFHWPGLILCHTEYKQMYAPSYDRPYFVAFLTYDCKKNRDDLFQQLRDMTSDLESHALGKCMNNFDIIKSEAPKIYEHIQSFLTIRDEYCLNENIFRNYRWALVMENHANLGYMTEKIIEAFQSGAIPIHWGLNYSHVWFNPKAYIRVQDFDSPEECAKHIISIDRDEEKYNQMIREPVFKDNKLPDIFKGKDSEHYKKIAKYLRMRYDAHQLAREIRASMIY